MPADRSSPRSITPIDAWLRANERRVNALRAEVQAWTGIEVSGPVSPAERVRVNIDRTRRLPTLAEIDLLAGHDPARPPAGRVNIWAAPGWWRASPRWRHKESRDVPLLFRSKPGPRVEEVLGVVDPTFLCAALRSLDPLPLWREQAARMDMRAAARAETIEATLALGGLSPACRAELEARAHDSRSRHHTTGWFVEVREDGTRVPVRDALLAADAGGSPLTKRQSKTAAQARFLVPTWNLLARLGGWGPNEWAEIASDEAWIPLCPDFLSGAGDLPDRLRKAHARADK